MLRQIFSAAVYLSQAAGSCSAFKFHTDKVLSLVFSDAIV